MSDTFVRVDLREVEALMRRFPELAPAIRRAEVSSMRRIVLEGERRAKAAVSVDTGHYRRSISSDVQVGPRTVVGQFGSNLPYAPVREFGRRAGAPMPPPGALRGWMRRHGIPLQLEFIIRRRIARRGITGERVFTKVLRELEPLAVRELARLKPTILATLRGRGSP